MFAFFVLYKIKARRAESESGSPGGSSLQLQATRKISTSQQHFHRPGNTNTTTEGK